MDAVAIDHLNVRIPTDGIDRALAFYRDGLGFDVERLDAFEAGERPFFAVRLAPESVLHLWPDEDFEEPTGRNFDHVAIHLDATGEEIRETVAAADVPIVDDRTVAGAQGEARSVYVRDPFGYLLELKSRH
jgi:catechol 2,3-dioxygenase-like lactoylglutathione lyase family enzyme